MKIEDLKAHCVEKMRKLPKTSKMYEEHLLTLAIIDTNKKYFDEIEKKDKMIDLMEEWIDNHTKYYDEDGCYCEVEKEICKKDIECKDCIKQYFEKLVKEKGEEYARNKI